MSKKFELTSEFLVNVFGVKLFRIKALASFSDVTIGDLGGFVEKEDNFSAEAQISGDAWIYGDAQISGNTWISGKAQISGDARIYGDARISDNAWIYGNAQIYGDAQISDNAWIYGNTWVSGDAWIYGDAQIYGDAWISGDARISGDAQLIWFSKVGSEEGTLTVFKAEAGLKVTRGCFLGTDVEFLAAVDIKHGADSKIGKEYHLLIEVARSRLGG